MGREREETETEIREGEERERGERRVCMCCKSVMVFYPSLFLGKSVSHLSGHEPSHPARFRGFGRDLNRSLPLPGLPLPRAANVIILPAQPRLDPLVS